MLTDYEVQKLQKSMRNESTAARGVVLKCVVWLVLLHIGLAWVDTPNKVRPSGDFPSSDMPTKNDSAEVEPSRADRSVRAPLEATSMIAGCALN